MKAKKIVCFSLGVVLLILFCMRVKYVNTDVLTIPVESYSVGEYVPLDGAFQDYDDENTDGYSVRINNATQMSYQDFLRLYGADEDYKQGAIVPKTVLDVEYTFRNDGNSDGYILLIQYIVEGKYYSLNYDSDLWLLTEPNGQGQIMFAINKDTECTVHVPYIFSVGFDKDLTDEELNVVVSRVPVKKVISLRLQ